MTPHRIRFATQMIKPEALPRFQYVSSVLAFDHVQFTAIIIATDVDTACRMISDVWPDAEFRAIEIGVSEFLHADTQLMSNEFGIIDHTKRPRAKRFFRWLDRA